MQAGPARCVSLRDSLPLGHPAGETDDPLMERDVITLGGVAERGAEMIGIRCGPCDRDQWSGLLAQHGPMVAIARVLQAQVGDCPNKDSEQTQKRCDPYCPHLPGLFRTSAAG